MLSLFCLRSHAPLLTLQETESLYKVLGHDFGAVLLTIDSEEPIKSKVVVLNLCNFQSVYIEFVRIIEVSMPRVFRNLASFTGPV